MMKKTCHPLSHFGVQEVTVEYLDYGGMEKLDPTSALRSLPGEYLELPFQGIHAALHGKTTARIILYQATAPLRTHQQYERRVLQYSVFD